MTKYVLVGGYPSQAPDHGRSLVETLTAGFPEPVHVLDVQFSKPRELWEDAMEHDQSFFARTLPGRSFQFELALAKNFTRQVKATNVIWIIGGPATKPILDAMSESPDWVNHLTSKTVGGSSSGAYVLASWYHELDSSGTGQGLGLVPVKIGAHWKSKEYAKTDWNDVRQQLDAINDTLPTLLLKEGEYRVF